MSQSLLINPSAMEASLEAAVIAKANMSDAQRAAFERYARLGMPNRRVEGWKWSDFNAAVRKVKPANDDRHNATIAPSLFAAMNPIEFHIVDGRISIPECGTIDGLEFGFIPPSATDPRFDGHGIAALNVAMTGKALGFASLRDANVERPLLIRHINTGASPTFSQILARAEAGSRLTVIETFEGCAPYHSSLFHLSVRDGAHFDRYVFQDAGPDTITHGFFGAIVGENARFRQTSLSTGGRLCRHETHLLYPSAGASSEISSAALVTEERHADFTSNIFHQGEGCQTRQLHKGVAKDRGRNVFQGKFHVERSAQQTDAKMTANALLLSDGAEANHKPELEIYADDVECEHGSTAGALDNDALFYLRQRGLSGQEARALLIEAFVGEVVEKINNDGVRDVFTARISEWLNAQ